MYLKVILFSIFKGRSMAIAKLGYEPRRFNKNDYTDESDTESDCESDTAAKSKRDFIKQFSIHSKISLFAKIYFKK